MDAQTHDHADHAGHHQHRRQGQRLRIQHARAEMREGQHHRAHQEDDALHSHLFVLGRVDRQKVNDQRRPPDAGNPAIQPADNAGDDLGPAGVVDGQDQRAARQLPDREGDDGHAQQQIHQALRNGCDKRGRDQDEHRHHRDMPAIAPDRSPCRAQALPPGLHHVRHQRRQDQRRQRDLRRQHGCEGRHHDHRHGETHRALDETGEQRDRENEPEGVGIKAEHGGRLAPKTRAATPIGRNSVACPQQGAVNMQPCAHARRAAASPVPARAGL